MACESTLIHFFFGQWFAYSKALCKCRTLHACFPPEHVNIGYEAALELGFRLPVALVPTALGPRDQSPGTSEKAEPVGSRRVGARDGG